MALALLSATALFPHLTSAGCHTGASSSDVPTLSLYTEDVSSGGSDAAVFGRILTGASKAEAVWSDWRKLDNVDCDDRERGNWDDYDDFEDLTTKWYAVALYNCGTDGHALSGIRWWDGNSYEDNIISHFCPNVAGPSRACYHDANADDDSCDAIYGGAYYDYVFIDQNNNDCNGVSIATGATSTNGVSVGQVWWKSNPGIPDCSGEYGAHAVKQPQLNEPQLKDMVMSENVVYCVALLLIALLSINVLCMSYNCVKSRRTKNKYSKVRTIASSDEEALNPIN